MSRRSATQNANPVDARDGEKTLRARLSETFAGAGQSIQPSQVGALSRYLELLDRWSRVYNLTAVRGAEAMITRHVMDSMSVLPFLREGPVLDVGTGAGLPGLVIAIAEPQREVVLLDASAKKTRFCQHVKTELGLRNVEVVTSRVEDYVPETRYASIVCRALLTAPDFYFACHAWLAPGGRLVHMKADPPKTELNALREAGVRVLAERVEVPGLAERRHLILVDAA